MSGKSIGAILATKLKIEKKIYKQTISYLAISWKSSQKNTLHVLGCVVFLISKFGYGYTVYGTVVLTIKPFYNSDVFARVF